MRAGFTNHAFRIRVSLACFALALALDALAPTAQTPALTALATLTLLIAVPTNEAILWHAVMPNPELAWLAPTFEEARD